MTRIVHVISSPGGIGGAERVMAGIVHNAHSYDHVVLNPFSYDHQNEDLARLCYGVDYHAVRCRHLIELPRTLRWLRVQLAKAAPDLVHVHLFHALVVTAVVNRLDVPYVLTHHHGSRYADEGQHLRASLDYRFGARYDRIVGVSEWTARVLREKCGYPDGKLSVIRNGWEGKPLVRGKPQKRPTIISIANLRWQKGHDILLTAMSQVVRALPDARLVLVGDGKRRPELTRLAHRLNLDGHVEWCGQVDDVWPLLRDADVFALASRHEPAGISILEAMAAGLPVVASAIGGIPEIVEPGVTGELFPVGDAALLADRLTMLLRNEQLRAEMGERARKYAAQQSMKRMAEQYETLYAEQVSTYGGRSHSVLLSPSDHHPSRQTVE
jgi:glycosyltransferase involved in cell wall biosynthesis